MVSHIDSDFLQMFLWEHFGALVAKLVKYSVTMASETGRVIDLRRAKNVYRACTLQREGLK